MAKGRMIIKQEVATYAQVLLEATKAKGNTLEVDGQLEEIRSTILRFPKLREALADNSIAAEAKDGLVKELFADYDDALVSLLSVMVQRGDLGLLHRVVEEFGQRAEEDLDVVILDVTTVVELDDALRETIKSKYAAQFGKEVLLREHVDPSIIGGIVLGAHGKRIDASIATKLEKTRVALSSVTTGGER